MKCKYCETTKKYGTGLIMPKVSKVAISAVSTLSKRVVSLTITKLIETKELKEGDRLDVRLWVTPKESN